MRRPVGRKGCGEAVQTQLKLSRSHRFPSLPQRRTQPEDGSSFGAALRLELSALISAWFWRGEKPSGAEAPANSCGFVVASFHPSFRLCCASFTTGTRGSQLQKQSCKSDARPRDDIDTPGLFSPLPDAAEGIPLLAAQALAAGVALCPWGCGPAVGPAAAGSCPCAPRYSAVMWGHGVPTPSVGALWGREGNLGAAPFP